jgi:hypothetical protein
LHAVPLAKIGDVLEQPRLIISEGGKQLIDADIMELQAAWKGALAG